MKAEINERLNSLLSEMSFFEENKDLENRTDIIKAIQDKVPEASTEDIDEFLTALSVTVQQNGELSEENLETVAGGIVITCTVVTTTCTVLGVAAAGGAGIGAAIWYWKNRNR